MERQYGRVLGKLAEECIPKLLPGFVRYEASTTEARVFGPGSLFFRRGVDERSFVYVVISPGGGKDCSFTVLLGWGFGDAIHQHNYLEQFRELNGQIWPTPRFLSGFEQLQVLEGAAAAWGESLPSIQSLESEHGTLTKEVVESVVRRTLVAAIDRTNRILPRFAAAITSAPA